VSAVVTGILGFLVMLCGGLPAIYSLIRRGPVSLPQLLLAGAALGNLPFAIYAGAMSLFAVEHFLIGTLSEHLIPAAGLVTAAISTIAIGSGMGIVSGAVAWVVVIRGTDVAA
jgi:hypothetical protein